MGRRGTGGGKGVFVTLAHSVFCLRSSVRRKKSDDPNFIDKNR
jgi:hypothetical protein